MSLTKVEPIIIFHSLVPKLFGLNVQAVTVGGYIFMRDGADPVIINHESIHVIQYFEMGFLSFFMTYVDEYIRNRVSGMSHSAAYRSISLEREAYDHEADMAYLDVRRHRAWEAYVGKNRWHYMYAPGYNPLNNDCPACETPTRTYHIGSRTHEGTTFSRWKCELGHVWILSETISIS